MSYIMVDVEADGPVPGIFSMTELGAVVVREGLGERFYGSLRPLPGAAFDPQAMKVTGYSREDLLGFNPPGRTIAAFIKWVESVTVGKPYFIADNVGFDWGFVNWYCHKFEGYNPFGHTARSVADLYKGQVGSVYKNFKHLRKAPHDHNPVNDALGNAEALMYMANEMGLTIPLE